MSLIINTEAAKAHFRLLQADRAAIEAELGTIPDGKRGCIVAVNAGNGWIELLTMAKIDDHWQVAGRLRHERATGLAGGVEIRMVW